MLRENSNKVKLLKLMEILKLETDEEHPISRRNLLERLLSDGFTCDIRTLSKDIATLNDFGYEVMIERRRSEMFYYVAEHQFSAPELKVLIDAVQASSFITEKKTKELTDKLASLGGSYRAAITEQNIVNFNTHKHTNESVFYSVDTLEQAIRENKKVIFRYYDLDEKAQPVYRRDGHHYIVEPVALVFNEDNYYLVSYSARDGNTANYRVDRMTSVDLVDEDISKKAIALRKKVALLTETAFKMFNGPSENVTLQFAPSALGAIYDKFGESISVQRVDENTLSVTVPVQISPAFYGWVFQFGKQMRITAPENVREGFYKMVEEVEAGKK